MTVENKIKKRIQTRQTIEHRNIEEIQITKKEAKELGNLKTLNGVRLIVVDRLGDMTQTDCFAYIDNKGHKSCYCLNKLYCTNEECSFYKKKDDKNNIEMIEKSIEKYFEKG